MKKRTILFVLLLLLMIAVPVSAMAANEDAAASAETEAVVDNTIGWKALASGLAIGIASTAGAISMGKTTAKAVESIANQPEADGKIRTTMMLGLVFIETAIIYALLAGILIIFVL